MWVACRQPCSLPQDSLFVLKQSRFLWIEQGAGEMAEIGWNMTCSDRDGIMVAVENRAVCARDRDGDGNTMGRDICLCNEHSDF
jgi:hypothetical protein